MQTATHTCENGATCPAHLACDDAHGGCVAPDQITACAGQEPFASCSAIDNGRCIDGVCLATRCGDGYIDVDVGERCDDGNTLGGDGCAVDCTSDERCGNGIVDMTTGESCDDGNRLNHDTCDVRCRVELPVWRSREPRKPEARSAHRLVFDPVRGQTVMYGGHASVGGTEFSAISTWSWDGIAWRDISPAVGSPGVRLAAAGAYDSKRGLVLVFGGEFTNDLWAWNGEIWQQLEPQDGLAPPPRAGHAMVYDAARDRLVVFGGHAKGDVSNPFGDTWEWDGAVWREIVSTPSPAPRSLAAAAYDPRRGRMVLFGGLRRESSGDTLFDDTWGWNGASWEQITGSAGPSRRRHAAMAYDASTGCIVLFGGILGTDLADTWELDGSIWTDRTPASSPAGRGRHHMTYDAQRRKVVMYGGTMESPTFAYHNDDVWEWDGLSRTWNHVVPVLTKPPARSRSAATFDMARGHVVLFGGLGAGGLLDDTWTWNGRRWDAPISSTPPARRGHALAYLPSQEHVVLFGGGTPTLQQDTWIWDGTAWTPRTPTTAPPARDEHTATFDPAHGVVVHGGDTLTGNQWGDTWAWNGTTWSELATASIARAAHVQIYDSRQSRLLVFTGRNNARALTDMTTLGGAGWTAVTPSTAEIPAPRNAAGFVYDPVLGRALLFGSELFLDMWEWTGSQWHAVALGRATPRTSPVMVYDPLRAETLVFGGTIGTTILDDLWSVRYENPGMHEVCTTGFDADGDALSGCMDPDCWAYCTPHCPPGSSCDPTAQRCGDGTCDAVRETCRNCPADCTSGCVVSCGDYWCDAGETTASCPGDCQ